MQKNYQASIEKYALENGQIGVRSIVVIMKGSFICEYRGEIIDREQMTIRKQQYATDNFAYMFKMAPNLIIDARNFGNISRFVNHSCDANCDGFVIDSLGELRLALFANREIPIGKEITINYKNLKESYVLIKKN